jgi:hypothetical protein
MTVQAPNGIDFTGIHFGTGGNGGLLTINANSQVFSSAGGINGANFNGGDNPGGVAGSGGQFQVNTATTLNLLNTTISATTGMIDAGADSTAVGGNGGTVSLTAGGELDIQNSTIQVSSSDPAGTVNRHSSANGGNINLSSAATTGIAIQVDSTSQLLSLLEAASTGHGGLISIQATAPTGNNSALTVSGAIQADHGAIDIRHFGNAGVINVVPMMSADIIKVAVLGDNGRLNIGGPGSFNANTVLKLYADGSNGQINFVADCILNGGTANIIAANTVTIQTGVMVNVTGHMADVFTNNANYTGSGGNGLAGGTFGGLGANNPQPFVNRPVLGPPGGP